MEPKHAAEGRRIAVVIAAAAALWIVIEALGGHYDWPPRYIFLADLSAAAAFIWAMVAAFRLWRSQS